MFHNLEFVPVEPSHIEWLISRPWYNQTHEQLNEILTQLVPNTQVVASLNTHIQINPNKCVVLDPSICGMSIGV